MKTKLTLLLMLLLTTALGAKAEKEMYTVLSPDGTTLTYYFDDAKEAKEGTIGEIGYIDKNVIKVVFDESFAEARPTTTRSWFSYMSKLTEIKGMENLNTSEVTNMSNMFNCCTSLTTLDVSHLVTSNVTNMYNMFAVCSSLDALDVSNFDTSNVTNMRGMFSVCSSLKSLDLSKFNTSNVTDMRGMFYNCTSLESLEVDNFDTSNVTMMGGGPVVNDGMFYGCSSLTSLDVTHFDTSNVSKMGYLFGCCNSLTSLDVTHFNTSNVTEMQGMFVGCSSLTSLDVTNFNTSKVTDMGGMFQDCSSLTSLDVTHFDTSNVTIMGGTGIQGGNGMFGNCSSLTSLDVTHFDTSKVTGMGSMFWYCSNLTSLDLSSFDTSNVTGMGGMFMGCSNLTTLDVSHFETSKVTDMRSMFCYCSSLTSLDVSHFNTSNVIYMGAMFYDCSSLTSLDVSNFNTSNVIEMGISWSGGMFHNCKSLKKLDLSYFDTSNVTGMYNMFNSCSQLSTIYVGEGWGVRDDCGTTRMFTGCTKLVGGMGTTYNANYQDGTRAHIDGGTANPGYLTDIADLYAVKPYVVAKLIDDVATITYYYDDQHSVRDGSVLMLNNWKYDMVSQTRKRVQRIVFDESFAEARPTSTSGWFSNMTSLQEIVGMENLNTSNVTEMFYMFQNCSSLTSLDVSHFDTSNVTNMMQMFMGCSSLTGLDVSNFDLSKVKDMNNMFRDCSSLESLDVSQFNTSNVTAMGGVFYGCSSLTSLDVSNFDLSNVEQTWWLFNNCSSLKELSVSSSMTNISDDACTNVGTAESPCTLIVPEDFDYGVDTAGDYFQWKSGYFKLPVPETGWKEEYTVLSEDGKTLTYYYDDTMYDKVGTINYIGYNDDKITKVIFDASFAEARPTQIANWFTRMSSLKEIVGIENLNTSEVDYMGYMFRDCSRLTSLDLSHFDTSNVTYMDYMFYGCSSLTSLDLSNFDTSNVTSMQQMFRGCSNLTSLDLSHFDTSNVTNMSYMFNNCKSLTSLDLSHFDTSNVTNMYSMFDNCKSLTSLDVSHFDTSNVTNMFSMFYNCSSLTSLDLSNFDTSNVKYMYRMFRMCESLTSLDLSHFDTSNVTASQEMISFCPALTTLTVSATMSNISDDACEGVGTTEAPCLLIIPEGFDYGVDTAGDYFQWKSGYFKLEDEGAPVIAELTLDENAENEIPENGTLVQTVNTVRTLMGGVWNTLCLPFTVTADAMADENHPLHGATIMSLTDAFFDVAGQAQHLMFSQQSEIKAGAPYVVKVSENVVNPTYSNVTIEAQEPVTTQVGDWRMVGIYSPYTFTIADNGIFFLTSGNRFSYVAQPGTMKGMRAFFALDGYSDYANIVVCFDEATGISQVNATPVGDDKVYDLQGRSLNHAPTHGVFIINGKKIVK